MSNHARVHIECEVLRNEAVSSRYWLMSLHAPQIAAAARPGQFIQLRPFPKSGPREFCSDPLLPRPFAVYAAREETIEILYFVVGRGTRMMAELETGASVTALGPLGVPFTMPDGDVAHVAIGGGTGLAPLRLLFANATGRDTRLILGAREADIHPSDEILDVPDTQVSRASDDGSGGFHGTAVALAEQILDDIKTPVQIYAAGPVPMMQAAFKLAERRGLPCQVSLEALMACGVGVCRSCVVDGCDPNPETGLARRAICTEGPVFDASQLDWSTVVRAHG